MITDRVEGLLNDMFEASGRGDNSFVLSPEAFYKKYLSSQDGTYAVYVVNGMNLEEYADCSSIEHATTWKKYLMEKVEKLLEQEAHKDAILGVCEIRDNPNIPSILVITREGSVDGIEGIDGVSSVMKQNVIKKPQPFDPNSMNV